MQAPKKLMDHLLTMQEVMNLSVYYLVPFQMDTLLGDFCNQCYSVNISALPFLLLAGELPHQTHAGIASNTVENPKDSVVHGGASTRGINYPCVVNELIDPFSQICCSFQ